MLNEQVYNIFGDFLSMEEVKDLQLEQLSQEESNKAYSFQQLSEYYNNQFNLSKKGIYYPYNHLTKDAGMGCAWRAIQTLLSTHGVDETFLTLYEKYNKKEVLLKILEEKKAYSQEVLQILGKEIWAPGERKSHSGQPYIASIACRANDIPHKFFGINGYHGCHAPPAIFEEIITFQQFYTLAKSVIGHSSIMIDDGYYALSIIGINLNLQDRIEFLFGDPHVRDNRNQKSVGVYRKTFDLTGKSIGGEMTEIQKAERLYEVYEALQFDAKKWMVCLILF